MNNRTMPAELKTMLDNLAELAECGGIRSYYDTDVPEEYGFHYKESPKIHNFFCLIEGLTEYLLKEDIPGAEKYLNDYISTI